MLIHTVTWIDLKNVLNEISQTHKNMLILDEFIFMKFYSRQNYSVEIEISAVVASAGDGQEGSGKGH